MLHSGSSLPLYNRFCFFVCNCAGTIERGLYCATNVAHGEWEDGRWEMAEVDRVWGRGRVENNGRLPSLALGRVRGGLRLAPSGSCTKCRDANRPTRVLGWRMTVLKAILDVARTDMFTKSKTLKSLLYLNSRLFISFKH